ncbi:MAG: hypothetical protein R6X34_15480 [Chloroflexota bacterium]
MSVVIEPLLCLLSLGLFLVFVMAILSPFEALGWWSGWSKNHITPQKPAEGLPLRHTITDYNGNYYLVYLTAVGGVSAQDISKRERGFLERLQTRLEDAVIVDDVFPFSVSNNPLNGERQLGWLWRRIHDSRMRGRGSLLVALIFVRNVLQVGVSGDRRYGPIYNVGVAREIALSLLKHGYDIGSGKPITVMGWSGGGQIAVGVVPYLHQALDAPVYVASIGGVITDEPGVAAVEHLYHLQSSKDKFPKIGDLLYPGRWKIVRYSEWNQAKADGRITIVDPGPMIHTGKGDYFDRHVTQPDGTPNVERTVNLVVEFIKSQPLPAASEPENGD